MDAVNKRRPVRQRPHMGWQGVFAGVACMRVAVVGHRGHWGKEPCGRPARLQQLVCQPLRLLNGWRQAGSMRRRGAMHRLLHRRLQRDGAGGWRRHVQGHRRGLLSRDRHGGGSRHVLRKRRGATGRDLQQQAASTGQQPLLLCGWCWQLQARLSSKQADAVPTCASCTRRRSTSASSAAFSAASWWAAEEVWLSSNSSRSLSAGRQAARAGVGGQTGHGQARRRQGAATLRAPPASRARSPGVGPTPQPATACRRLQRRIPPAAQPRCTPCTPLHSCWRAGQGRGAAAGPPPVLRASSSVSSDDTWVWRRRRDRRADSPLLRVRRRRRISSMGRLGSMRAS